MPSLSRLCWPLRARRGAALAMLPFAVMIAGPAAAQSIYKVQMPDGSILFTDTPPQGGKILEERDVVKTTPRPARPAATPATSQIPGTSNEPTKAAPAANRLTLDAAIGEINAAETALAAARRRLELGREPLPGERLGLAGGGSRLSPEYHSRIAGLEREVAEAEERVKRAYVARNSVR